MSSCSPSRAPLASLTKQIRHQIALLYTLLIGAGWGIFDEMQFKMKANQIWLYPIQRQNAYYSAFPATGISNAM